MYIKCLYYIQYNCGRCTLKIPGGGHDRDRAQKRARSPAMSPGSAEALSGNADIVLDVFDKIFDVEGAP